jgi:DNA-directed RNA polymerase subunit beta'
VLEVNGFTGIRISLASPEQIRSWSYGEVTKPETINYRTLKPEKDGLFCERIFGPTKDWECYCGKYKRVRYKGIVCDKCGVEVARAKVRRERMGHIELASPVSHIWYFKGTPSYLGILLDITPRNLEKILYFANYIVTKIDEEGRQEALARSAADLEERVEFIQNSRADRLVEIEELREQRSRDLEATHTRDQDNYVRRREELPARVETERQTLLERLEALRGQEAEEDIKFTPSEAVIVPAGAVVDDEAFAAAAAEVERWARAEEAKIDADTAKSDSDRENKLARFQNEAETELRNVDRKIESEAVEERERGTRGRSDLETLKVYDLISEQKYRELKELYPQVFEAGMGAEAVRDIIMGLDLNELSLKLRDEIRSSTGSGLRRKKATKRLRVVEHFRKSGARPEWMVLTVLPVIPPDLRPMVQLDGGRFATSDLNDLYRRVINRNNRLKRLLELGAPDIIIRNEKRMLQEAVDALIDNGRRGRPVSGSGNHKLKSLSDMLKGKQGRFRQNLLGKRVDYSGRSVIVVGPHLKLHQCGLPKRMAVELFKPFVMRKLVERGFAHNIKSAKRIVERQRPEVWDVLEEVVQGHPVLLNRAPTLHRLGIQAFDVILVEGSAIQIHPLVCTAFNADFDGDQMAVHVPLSQAAQDEARQLMLASQNLLSPADGEPIVSPTKDMVLGCYYLMSMRPDDDPDESHNIGRFKVFDGFEDAFLAREAGMVSLQTPVYVRVNRDDYENPSEDGYVETSVGRVRKEKIEPVRQRRPDGSVTVGKTLGVKTTVGRLTFNNVLPEALRFYNDGTARELVDKANMRRLIGECFRRCGTEVTAETVDQIKNLGFHYATTSGTTAAMDDIAVPAIKAEMLAIADADANAFEDDYRGGLITEGERTQNLIARWKRVEEELLKEVRKNLPPFGPIAMMAESGAAKGGFNQIRQLAGLRGLFANPKGQIIPLPVRSNLREGLTVLEYFMSTHGARKGLADTAIRTAESGYLTRRLIDVAQDVIVYEEDCGTENGITIRVSDSVNYSIEPGTKPAQDLFRTRLNGRVLARSVADPRTGEIIAERNQEMNDTSAHDLTDAGIDEVLVRSALTCEARRGMCALCYGRNLATGEPIGIGEAVGIIAAQSIGEPGTQLTMRTFHTGGVAGEDITMGLPRVEELFEARIPKEAAILTEIGGKVSLERTDTSRKVKVVSQDVFNEEHALTSGMQWTVADGDHVEAGALLTRPVSGTVSESPDGEVLAVPDQDYAQISGTVSLEGDRAIIRYHDSEEREYNIPPTARLKVDDGIVVQAGQELTEGPANPQDKLRVQGREAVQRYLVAEVQKVYRSQGVPINDKHIEIIIRQMLRRVKVEEAGDTDLLPGELVDRFTFEEINARVLAEGGEPATAESVLLGVTKASLNTESFLAKASFQETTRVLTEAAIAGARDRLTGLKENVIIGKLIPAGTGLVKRAQLAEQARLALEQAQTMVAEGLPGEFPTDFPDAFPEPGEGDELDPSFFNVPDDGEE